MRNKRKALDAGIQAQKAETAAPGSAEVRLATRRRFPSDARVGAFSFPLFSNAADLASNLAVAHALNPLHSPSQRAASKSIEVQREEEVCGNVEDQKRALARAIDALKENSKSHVETVVNAAKALHAMRPFILDGRHAKLEDVTLLETYSKEAVEILRKAVKSKKLTSTEANLAAVPRVVDALIVHPLADFHSQVTITIGGGDRLFVATNAFAHEVGRRACEVITKLVIKSPDLKKIARDGDVVPSIRQLMLQHAHRELKMQKHAAAALITLDEHVALVEAVRKATESMLIIAGTEVIVIGDRRTTDRVGELREMLRRDVHALGELAKLNYAGAVIEAGAIDVIVPLLRLSADTSESTTSSKSSWTPTQFADVEKEVCYAIGAIASDPKHQRMVVDAGAVESLVNLLGRQAPHAPVDPVSRRGADLVQDVARKAADVISKLANKNEDVKKLVRRVRGVEAMRMLLDRRDSKVQRAGANALITLDHHFRLVKDILDIRMKILADPDDDRLRDRLKQDVRTLAELSKETQQNSDSSENVDAVVNAGAVEAIVPLLSMSTEIGEKCTPNIGDIEKEACYAIGLLASKEDNQNRIAAAGALPGLVALLKRYPPQLSGSIPPSVARRAADAVTNLAHENNDIKNQVRTEGGIPPLVSLLETRDPKVQRAAASALRTLAFKNDENKNQIVECGALPMLIFMVRSEDQTIHYEAIGVIGNLVHSSSHIKRRVLDEGALQPVISLLSSECPESQREAALLIGQFATTEPAFKVKIVQRGAVQPLIQMLNNTDPQLREMAAFALGRLAQNEDNQVGICHADGLRPLLDLLDSNAGNLQHNAAFALYGLAENPDNIPDIIMQGTVQRLNDGELIVQASKDCVAKTLKRLEEKMTGRTLRYLIYMMRTTDKEHSARIAVALAHLCGGADKEQEKGGLETLSDIFMDHGGLEILLEMIAPKHSSTLPSHLRLSPKPRDQKDAAAALYKIAEKITRLAPEEAAPLPATPETHLEEHFDNPELADLVFEVSGEEMDDADATDEERAEKRTFYAHRIAFSRASDAFHDMIAQGKRQDEATTTGSDADAKREGACRVDIKHITVEAFEALLKYVYTGQIPPSNDPELGFVPKLACTMLKLGEKYQMLGLKRQCETALAEDVKNAGVSFNAVKLIKFYDLAIDHRADKLARACVLHALEHHASIIKSIGPDSYSKLLQCMVPTIREHLHGIFYRVGSALDAANAR